MAAALDIPPTPAVALAKLRCGLAEYARFCTSAPCLALCWLVVRCQIAAARTRAWMLCHTEVAAAARSFGWLFTTGIPAMVFWGQLFLYLAKL